MAIDFKSLKNVDSGPGQIGRHRRPSGMVEVLITIRKRAKLPKFIRPRSRITAQKFAAEITLDEMQRAKEDPRVESIAITRKLPLID
jgi:hypothetical protein